MNSIIISTLILLVLVSCSDDANPVIPKTETHNISGKVINYITDLPVDGVFVTTAPLSRTSKTDSEGKFVLEGVEEGEYEIILQKYGYSELRSPIKVNSNTTAKEILFPLIPDSTSNEKPFKPELISPLNRATISTTELLFRWYAEDIDNKDISFSVYFGTDTDNLSAIATNLKKSSFNFEFTFQKNTTYYWKVVSSNLFQSVSSETYEFEYGVNNKPDKPKLITPAMDEIIHSNEVEFNWSGNDIDGDELLYDIYLGTSKSQLFLLDSNLTSTSYIYNYDFNETDKYYWRVDAKDKSYSVESDIFEYTYKDTTSINTQSLVGYWKLNGNADDSGPNKYNGTEEGVFYVKDRKNTTNSAANFNGLHQTLDSKILLSKNIRLKNTFTIALWVNQAQSRGENGGVGNFDCFSQWGGAGDSLASYNLGVEKNGFVYFTTYGNNNAKMHETFNDQLEIGTWNHIAISFNNGTVRYYLNGVVNGILSGFPVPQASKLNPSIGGRQDQLSSFHGAIDDVIVFSRVLTDQEIKNLAK